jgi:hypothetical protein
VALLTHGELPYSIEDAGVFPYSAGVPGTLKDIPGIRRVEMDAQIEETEHRGDNRILAVAASINSFDLTLEIGQLNLDAIAALSGGTVATTGTTPDQIRTLTRKSTDVIADYQIKAKTTSKTSDGGAFWLTFPRCQWVGGPSYALADNEFPVMEITARAVPQASTNTLYIASQYENVATAIA